MLKICVRKTFKRIGEECEIDNDCDPDTKPGHRKYYVLDQKMQLLDLFIRHIARCIYPSVTLTDSSIYFSLVTVIKNKMWCYFCLTFS